jgi:hypothetical protein
MKIKIRPDDARMIQDNHWRQMNDWPAELRHDGAAGPPGDGDPGQKPPPGPRLPPAPGLRPAPAPAL